MRQKQVDGIILKTWFDLMPDAVSICCSGNMPCVSVATPCTENIPGVWVDPEVMGHTAYDYLYSAGHRRIALCSMNDISDWVKKIIDRIRHDKNAEYIFCSAQEPDWCSRIFEHAPEITAVIAPDMMAIKVLSEAHARHVKVPEELSVLAMDGADIEQFTIPPLTSIIQPRAEQGEEAARLLLEWINTRQTPEKVVLQPMIRERASVCKH
jgi:LacI family transcriptional regulator